MENLLQPSLQAGKLLFESNNKSNNSEIIQFLDALLTTDNLQKIFGDKDWEKLIYDLIVRSNYNVKVLLEQRSNKLSNKTLFTVLKDNSIEEYSYSLVFNKVKSIADKLNPISNNFKIGILSENCVEMIFVDLASLYNGVVDVVIPPNISEEHVNFILEQSQPQILFIQNERLYQKVRTSDYYKNNKLEIVILQGNAPFGTITLNSFINNSKLSDSSISEPIGINDLATIMYTSGTTGEPKGIMFSNANIIYKRFCRAIALPKIGNNDVFLSYLPLYHTFGRYLEMLGTIFWGASYVFAENPSIQTLIKNMQLVKPSVFISIPKKWVQLYDTIAQTIDIEVSRFSDIKDTLNEITGGNLTWGLSAAGFLSPDVFKFFQKHGVNLLSGFGMTEATGGITMTPPDKYKENSIGIPLPGIETRLGDENELLIRGKYVTQGYFGNLNSPFVDDDWYPTGDIMKIDDENYHYIIDRKKDIYKNSRGETIAPQKIENYFLESDFIQHVFLVGDHRPFNTILIYPDFDNEVLKEYLENNKNILEIFETVIVSINQFLPNHERIIDFRIINRPFSVDFEELTPKNTLKRWVIERNFIDLIQDMYKKNLASFIISSTEISSKIELNLPAWFLKENGLLAKDVICIDNKIVNKKNNKVLIIGILSENKVQIGDFIYRIMGSSIEFQDIITNPILWMGNRNLVEFCGDYIADWIRQEKTGKQIIFDSISTNLASFNEQQSLNSVSVNSFISVHLSFCLLYSEEKLSKLYGINYLKTLIEQNSIIFNKIPKELFFRIENINSLSVLREIYKIALNNFSAEDLKILTKSLISKYTDFFNKDLIEYFSEYAKTDFLTRLEEIIEEELKAFPVDGNLRKSTLPSLLELLSDYGVNHPTKYTNIRQIFVKFQVFSNSNEFSLMCSLQRKKMRTGFREWLGNPMKMAVDIEQNKEYRWKDVLVFHESIKIEDKKELLDVISSTNIIKETVFFFSKGILINLNNIVPAGVKISLINEETNRKLFLVSIQTRFQGAFTITITKYLATSREELIQEFNWRILAGSRYFINEFIEDFGGIWDEYNIFTSNYIKGTTVRQQLIKHTKVSSNKDFDLQLINLWQFYIWNCSAVYFNFLRLTNMKFIVSPSSIDSYFVPEHDYHTGSRLISFSNKENHINIKIAIEKFIAEFLNKSQAEFPFLNSGNQLFFVFSGLINSFGEEEGLKLLRKTIELHKDNHFNNPLVISIKDYIKNIQDLGYFPKQFYFAVQRFLLWYRNNKTASLSAVASFLNDIYVTYNLSKFEFEYPHLKIRFYTETVFSNSSFSLIKSLQDIGNIVRQKKVPKEFLFNEIMNLKNVVSINSFEEFFLTRLSHPFLKPDDSALILKTTLETGNETNLVLKYEDIDKATYFIRKPINPNEINKLYQLFLDSDLTVSFNSYHNYLVVTNEQGFVIGGLFYFFEDSDTVRMEKIVIGRKFRGKGISDTLMKDFISRIILKKIKYLVTGYFRPQYFGKFGFILDERFGGLVKILE